MARDTLRDKVWKQIVQYREAGEEFTKSDIEAGLDVSPRTVHDVLRTAVRYGLLEQSERTQMVDHARAIEGKQNVRVAVFEPPGNDESPNMATQNPPKPESSSSNPTPDRGKQDSNASEDVLAEEAEVEWPGVNSPEVFAEALSGIGEEKARRMWVAGFNSFAGIFNASVEELTQVAGIGARIARKLKIQMAGFALNETGRNKSDLVEMETETVADMLNLPESLVDDLQTEINREQIFA
jgi:hypothetical protein